MDTHDCDVVVLGGGAAGLTAAWRAAVAGRSVRLFERSPTLGGLAAPFEVAGVRVDHGSHRLPWLSVKYVPVAAALALLGVLLVFRRRTGRDAAALVGALAVAGAAYLLLHRMIYGGWTVYAAGDHFQGSGEFGVVGFDPNYPGRSIRILGLLIDRDFGLAAWQPAWLLLVPAAAAMLGRRPARQPREAHSAALRSFARGPSLAQRTVLLVPLATGWLTATYIALTMHGFWWPGRQLVVLLPVAVLVILCWVSRLSAPAQLLGAVAASWGLGIYGVVL